MHCVFTHMVKGPEELRFHRDDDGVKVSHGFRNPNNDFQVADGEIYCSHLATWIALADVPPGTGFCLVPGSHKSTVPEPEGLVVEHDPPVSITVPMKAGDVVVFSARAIPANQRAIERLKNAVARHGAEIVDEGTLPVHVSGHACEDDLKRLLELVRPRCFVPIHGEYRYLAEHARVAARVTGGETTVLLAEDGDVIRLAPGEGRIAGRVAAERLLIDGARSGEVGSEVLRHRRHLAADGVVVPVIAVDRQEGRMEGTPDVVTRGVVLDDRTSVVLDTVPARLAEVIGEASPEERSDRDLLAERVRIELQRLFRKQAGRRPLVLPVIMEV
jgi:ribonuclease J